MEGTTRPPGRIRFGVFEVDLRAGELRRKGLKVKLQEQPFQVLAVLLEHVGEVVAREDLQKKLWPADTFVDFDHGLNKTINKIRQALGDSAENPRFVETLGGRGYRFIADVTVLERPPLDEVEPARAAPLTANVPDRVEPPGTVAVRKHRSVPLAWKVVGFALVLVLATLAAWTSAPRSRPSPSIRSLAVLPLESLSNDPSQEYFADGMTDELITDLGQISALRVISRTSVMQYKHARKPLPQIARELSVDAVVEGTVLRSGDQVRITAQLVAAPADRHLWAHSYEGELRDNLALQNQVARAIAEQIRINLNRQEQAAFASTKVVEPEAYLAYLKGRYFWNKRTAAGLKAAVGFFEQAIGKDPRYAQAYSGLADAYALLGDWEYAVMTPKEALPRAKAAAVKALELDDTLGEAHTSLAFCLDVFDWDFDAAEKEFRRAIDVNPGYATAYHWHAWHLALRGRHPEALAEMRKALNLDPMSLIINTDLAELLLIARSYDESIEQSRKAIEMDAAFGLAHNQLAQAYLQEQQSEKAIAELREAIRLSGGSPTCTANLARAYAASGRRKEAVDLLDDLKKQSTASRSPAAEIAMVYAALGDEGGAMGWLEKAFADRFNPSLLLRPGFDPLRSDPRFKELLRRIGLGP
jgi:TolB-like protein/DNA-binding winged helix-turn-helix (wHTH) protein/Flp pilus assembly protein TadD